MYAWSAVMSVVLRAAGRWRLLLGIYLFGCKDCGFKWRYDILTFICPKCGGSRLKLLSVGYSGNR